MRLGDVEEEKFTKIISNSGKDFNVDMRVMVFPEPGGPQRMNGRCYDSHEQSISWCLNVSTVVMMRSASVTL